MKNLTPAQIVLRSALVVFFGIILLEVGLILFGISTFNWVEILLVPFISTSVAYIVYYIAIEKFIYRKIKLIYKNILNIKSTKLYADQHIEMQNDIVGEMKEEVTQWAKAYTNEIEQLKKNETFRKEFIGNVSHELKTPITSIQGYLETLIDGGLKDQTIATTYLEKAMLNVERMVELVDDLVSISNMESGEIQINYSEFDMNELTKEILEALEIHAEPTEISLRIKDGCDHAFRVWADIKLIREVLNNLVINGIKYGKKNGVVQVGYYLMGDNILIEVSDNGIGIANEHLTRVFERFFRIERSRSRDFGGTGLGLSIVKHIIEAHQQTVTVRSTLGMGSTFGFTLKKA